MKKATPPHGTVTINPDKNRLVKILPRNYELPDDGLTDSVSTWNAKSPAKNTTMYLLVNCACTMAGPNLDLASKWHSVYMIVDSQNCRSFHFADKGLKGSRLCYGESGVILHVK